MATKISWTEETWNPITGCTPISTGCKNCYAESTAQWLQKERKPKYRNGFELTLHEDALNEPKHWQKPRIVFVCSMSDIFHKAVPFDFIDKIMAVISSTPWHTYQILTKRAERMAEYFSTRAIPSNVWLGVTVEAQSTKNRIDILRELKAPIRFLSCEPLVEDLGELNLENIDWIIVGGESVPHAYHKARPMKEEWVLSIKEQCDKQGTLFYFKQWGTWGSDGVARKTEKNGEELGGKLYDARPHVNRHTLFG